MNNFENNLPIYLQIADKIKVEIFGGRLASGERLVPVRELALKERVNPNTVQRALFELEREGLIYTERTNGKFVTEDVELIGERREKYAEDLTREYENKMQEVGAEVKIPKIMWPVREVRGRHCGVGAGGEK